MLHVAVLCVYKVRGMKAIEEKSLLFVESGSSSVNSGEE